MAAAAKIPQQKKAQLHEANERWQVERTERMNRERENQPPLLHEVNKANEIKQKNTNQCDRSQCA